MLFEGIETGDVLQIISWCVCRWLACLVKAWSIVLVGTDWMPSRLGSSNFGMFGLAPQGGFFHTETPPFPKSPPFLFSSSANGLQFFSQCRIHRGSVFSLRKALVLGQAATVFHATSSGLGTYSLHLCSRTCHGILLMFKTNGFSVFPMKLSNSLLERTFHEIPAGSNCSSEGGKW